MTREYPGQGANPEGAGPRAGQFRPSEIDPTGKEKDQGRHEVRQPQSSGQNAVGTAPGRTTPRNTHGQEQLEVREKKQQG